MLVIQGDEFLVNYFSRSQYVNSINAKLFIMSWNCSHTNA